MSVPKDIGQAPTGAVQGTVATPPPLPVWTVFSVEEFEGKTHNPGAPLPRIVTTQEIADRIQERGHGARFRTHEVEISTSEPQTQTTAAVQPGTSPVLPASSPPSGVS